MLGQLVLRIEASGTAFMLQEEFNVFCTFTSSMSLDESEVEDAENGNKY